MTKMFFTGKPCKRGHISNRYKSSRVCVECSKQNRADDYHQNKEKQKEQMKEWLKSNKEKIKKIQKQWRKNNRAKLLPAEKAWRDKNRVKVRAYQVNKKAKRKLADGQHSGEDIKNIYEKQKGKCAFCFIKLEKYHVDHIMPLAKGGTNWPHNIQILCPECNGKKHAKHPIDFAQENGRLL